MESAFPLEHSRSQLDRFSILMVLGQGIQDDPRHTVVRCVADRARRPRSTAEHDSPGMRMLAPMCHTRGLVERWWSLAQSRNTRR